MFTSTLTIEYLKASGTGTSKKIAKKNAALELISILLSTTENNFIPKKQKKNSKSRNKKSKNINMKNSVFSQFLNENTNDIIGSIPMLKENPHANSNDIGDYSDVNKFNTRKFNGRIDNDINTDENSSSKKRPYEKLQNLVKEENLKVEYFDFTKSGINEKHSIVALFTKIPIICYGEGVTVDHARDRSSTAVLDYLSHNFCDKNTCPTNKLNVPHLIKSGFSKLEKISTKTTSKYIFDLIGNLNLFKKDNM